MPRKKGKHTRADSRKRTYGRDSHTTRDLPSKCQGPSPSGQCGHRRTPLLSCDWSHATHASTLKSKAAVLANNPVEQVGLPRGAVAPRRFNVRTFESLKVRGYRFYFFSSLAQMAAMNMQMVVNGWYVYKLTDSASLLGLTMLANAIPMLGLAFLGGVMADRMPKRLLIGLGMVATSLLTLWIALSISAGIITWHYLLVNSFLQAIVWALVMPSRQAIVPELVGRDKLTNAIALQNTGMNFMQIGAPAIAGFMVAGVGIGGVYYLMAGLFLLAAALSLPLPKAVDNSSLRPPRRSVLGDIGDSLGYVRRNKPLLAVLTLSLFTVLFSMPFRMLLPVFTEDVLEVGPDKLGILMSVSGVGALVTSLAVASIRDKGRGMLFLHSGIVTGLSIIAFSLTSSYWVAMAIIAVAGVGQAARMALGGILVQSYTDSAHQGRVASLYLMQFGLTSLGTFGVSVAADFVGVQWAVGTTASFLVLLTLFCYAFAPRIRRLD